MTNITLTTTGQTVIPAKIGRYGFVFQGQTSGKNIRLCFEGAAGFPSPSMGLVLQPLQIVFVTKEQYGKRFVEGAISACAESDGAVFHFQEI